jgi:enoyl-CoA hydratase/carnithine racemase
MDLISLDRQDGVAIATLCRGVTNPINLDLVNALSDLLGQVGQDKDLRSLVLASSNDKFFSIGFDIPELIQLDREGMEVFYRALNRMSLDLYAFSKPTVASLTGHAIAGGCIVALCCDYRVIAEGRKLMGLNEVKLGVSVPYPADCILRSLVGDRVAREVMEQGEFHEAADLFRMGMVDEVSSLDGVRSRSIEKARSLGSLPHDAWSLIKRNRVGPVESRARAELEQRQQQFLDLWFSEEARERLREAAKKF